MRRDWWHAPIHVVVRRLFALEDGTLKVPVMTHRPHSGCYDFRFYRARRTEGRWRIQSPDIHTGLCY